jgi:sterol desaturase/sphingolipid hydroxylase (fatty acid hydroxylase superfamily)
MPMPWKLPAALAAMAALLFVAEHVRPLRRTVSDKTVRIARNVVVGASSFGLLAVLQPPVLDWVAHGGFAGSLAVLDGRAWPPVVKVIVAVLFLDYTLWIWHWLNHKVPFLWRFHLVHHVDRDLDASTGVRFHFGEMTLSIGFRAAQLAVIGGDFAVLGAWQAVLFASVLFHHSNVRLPERVDRALTWLVVTPRMHGIHHSHVHAETDSNWSSLFTIWDRLHGTLRLDVPQERIRIGVPAHAEESSVTLPRLLVMPFTKQRDDWLEGTPGT